MRKAYLPIFFAFIFYLPLPASASQSLQDWNRRYQKLEDDYRALSQKYFNLKRKVQNADQGLRFISAPTVCEGRLTLETGVPISTTDQANKSTLYFTPYEGDTVALYDTTTSRWVLRRFTEVSLALSGLTANTNYDVYLGYSSGFSLTLVAWSSNTARNAADSISASVGGVYTRATNSALRYLGTIRATASNQTQDTVSQRFVWNYQNQVQRIVQVTDATNTWTYATASWRQANASTNNKVEILLGLGNAIMHAYAMGMVTNGTGEVHYYTTGIGIDSTTTNSAAIYGAGSSSTMVVQSWAEYLDYPGLGYHAVNWLENGNATTQTIYGDFNSPNKYQSGLMGYILG